MKINYYKRNGQLGLADLRKEDALDINEMVQALGISKRTLINWEKNGLPNFEIYKKIIEHFELSIDMVLDLK